MKTPKTMTRGCRRVKAPKTTTLSDRYLAAHQCSQRWMTVEPARVRMRFDALEDIGRVPGDARGTSAFDLVDDKEHALLNRMWEMLGRLFLGALVELDHPNHKSAVRAGPPPPKSKDGRKRPKDTEPRAWIFDLRRDVKVDCRKFVGDYLAGNGKSPAVQVLVRGHHKRQPWGKDSMLRKWIHIEPYWKISDDDTVLDAILATGPTTDSSPPPPPKGSPP